MYVAIVSTCTPLVCYHGGTKSGPVLVVLDPFST